MRFDHTQDYARARAVSRLRKECQQLLASIRRARARMLAVLRATLDDDGQHEVAQRVLHAGKILVAEVELRVRGGRVTAAHAIDRHTDGARHMTAEVRYLWVL